MTDERFVAAIADAVAQRLERVVSPWALVDAATLARLLSVDVGYVYDHADELGAIRLGDGPKARLRFRPAEALERLSGCSSGRTSMAGETASLSDSRPTRRRRSGTGARSGVELLPIRGVRCDA